MDNKDFDLEFDFDKEYGFDPDGEPVDLDDDLDFDAEFLEGIDDQLGFDLNDPIFDEPAETPALPAEDPAAGEVPAAEDDALDLSGLDLGDMEGLDGLDEDLTDDMDYIYGEEAPEEDAAPVELDLDLDPEPETDSDAQMDMEEPDPVSEEAPQGEDTPPAEEPPQPRRRETRKERRQRIRKFKEDRLPRLIAMVAAGLILFFVAGTIIRAIVNGIEERRNQEEADASSQSAAQLLEQESQRLMDEAEKLAQGYDFEGAIAKLDSFSGELSAFPEMLSKRSEYNQISTQMVAWTDASKIPNLSFHVLIADPGRAFTDKMYGKKYNQNFVTIDEFEKILTQLYTNGYVLVSMEDVVLETVGTDGTITYSANTINLPKGKKPIMLTQTLVNYLNYMIDSDEDGEPDKGGDGFASRLVLDSNGQIKAEMVNAAGDTIVGDFDLVPILNSFIAEHPDFSYRGARAMLAVCGHEGIFGWRINQSVATSKGQDYYDAQVEGAKKIVEALRADGYELACYTYENIPYGTYDASSIRADLEKWNKEIKPVIGEVDTLIFAQASDINDYNGSKYNVIYSSGFRYFINNASAPWADIKSNFVRQSRMMVTGTNMAYYSNMFTSYFNPSAVMNSARGTVPK